MFTVDPAWCDIVYSFEITEPSAPNGQLAVTFDANMDQRIFTFKNIDNVALAGDDFIDYTVKVKAHAGIVTFKDTAEFFTLRLKSPCVDHNFITFNEQALTDGLVYMLYDYDPAPEGFKFNHDAYTVTTQPFDHTQCGDLAYNAYLDGVLMSDSSSPMAYDTLTR